MLRKIGERFAREVRVEHDRRRAVKKRELGSEVVRREPVADLHVRDGYSHIAVAAADEHVGRGAAVRHAEGAGESDAERFAALLDLSGARIAAERRQKLDVQPQQAHIVRNVAPHAAEAQLDLAGVGVLGAQGGEGMRADVNIHAAADGDIGGGGLHDGASSLTVHFICGKDACIRILARS